MAVLKFLAIFLILVLLPFGQIGKIDFNNLSFTFFDIGVIFLVLSWFIYSLINKEIKGKLILSICLFLLAGVLSLIANLYNFSSTQFLVAFSYLVRFIIFTGVYFVFKDFSRKFNEKIIKYFFLSGIMILAIGYLQFFFYPNLANLSYLGWDMHLYRLFATFLDPNFAGIYFVVILFTGIYLLKKEKNPIYLFFLSFTFLGIFLTYSRTALVALTISVITFLILSKKKKLFVGFIFLVILCITLIPKSFMSEGTDLFRTTSINERITSMNRGLTIFIDYPLLGVGFNAYRYAQGKYGFIDSQSKVPLLDRAGAGVENSFIFVLATTGIIGFIAYIFLLINFIKLFLQKKSDQYSLIMFSVFIGLIASSLFINSLFYTFIMFWMWMTIGIIESK